MSEMRVFQNLASVEASEAPESLSEMQNQGSQPIPAEPAFAFNRVPRQPQALYRSSVMVTPSALLNTCFFLFFSVRFFTPVQKTSDLISILNHKTGFQRSLETTFPKIPNLKEFR